MASAITLEGIDQAISNLSHRNKNALKSRLLDAIRQHYDTESDVETTSGIDSDELVRVLWNTGNDPEVIKHRRKNLSSIKSSINAELKKLFTEGKNIHGVIIGPANNFVMSDEAKEEILQSFTDREFGEESVTVAQISDVLDIVNDLLSNPARFSDGDTSDKSAKLDKLRDLINELAQKVGGTVDETIEEGEPDDVVESSEIYEDVEVVDVEDDIADEVDEIEELEENDEPLEEEDILEDVDLEEVLEEVDVEEDVEPEEIVEYEEVAEPEDSEEASFEVDEVAESDVVEDFEEMEVDEDDGVEEPEEDDEPLKEEDILDEIDIQEDLEEIDADDVEEIHVVEAEEEDLNAGILEEDQSDEHEEIAKARLLAEQFESYLATTDRNYNQHVLIPAGQYVVGNKHPKKNDRPEKPIRLSAFYIGQYPVTNALFEVFVDKTGYKTTAEKTGHGTVYSGRCRKLVDEKTGLEKVIWNVGLVSKIVSGACWYQPLGPGSTIFNKRNHPVLQVSREDAMAFAAWTGKRLPTEDEWEAAARTANGYVYPWGNEWEKNAGNIEESNVGETTPVDKFKAFQNDLGIVDTIGNVFEWTLDESEPDSSEESDSLFHLYVVKGGSWMSGTEIGLFRRFMFTADSRSNVLGFRCVAY